MLGSKTLTNIISTYQMHRISPFLGKHDWRCGFWLNTRRERGGIMTDLTHCPILYYVLWLLALSPNTLAAFFIKCSQPCDFWIFIFPSGSFDTEARYCNLDVEYYSRCPCFEALVQDGVEMIVETLWDRCTLVNGPQISRNLVKRTGSSQGNIYLITEICY